MGLFSWLVILENYTPGEESILYLHSNCDDMRNQDLILWVNLQ